MTGVERITPILRVESLAASVAYYVDVLGFRRDWGDEAMASVSRDGHAIMLCPGDQGHAGAWVWIGVEDVEALFAQVSGEGARIRIPPTPYPWALEMQVEDPDGNVLRFGSEPRPDTPFGDWLDMRGQRWMRTREGGWTRRPDDGTA